MATTDHHHIIAIGSYAGGLEEINTFFDHQPWMGFVNNCSAFCRTILKAAWLN